MTACTTAVGNPPPPPSSFLLEEEEGEEEEAPAADAADRAMTTPFLDDARGMDDASG